MNINGTLIIQAINFFIAYWMLTKFLLKPSVAIIEAEQSRVQELQQSTAAVQQDVQKRHDALRTRWQEAVQEFRTYYPQQRESKLEVDERDDIALDVCLPPKAELVDLTNEVERALIEKVVHNVRQ